ANDAHHLSAPAPDGAAARAAVLTALADAGLDAGAVSYVNAHGTGTVLNDRMEAALLAGLVGDKVPVSSTKSMTGHLMGASGAVESAVCVQAVRTGTVPGTRNCVTLADDCAGIDVVRGEPRRFPVSAALNVNFGFGGYNAALLFGPA
ncbi:MAG: beta-ketoacyl-[acyl-carrier-protein] synthase II, partial [Actinocatenispora sp.]